MSLNQNNICLSNSAMQYTANYPNAAVKTAATVPVGNTQYTQGTYPTYMQPQLYTPNIATQGYEFRGVQKILDKLDAYFYRLPNGQKVAVVPKKGPTTIKTYVNVGSMNEPDNLRGISHYIEHNLFNGTDNIGPGEFFSRVSKMGAGTNASTSFSVTDYYIQSQLLDTEDLAEKIKLHADMVQNPKFEQSMLEKERGPVISEISMVLDDPTNLAINKCIKNLFNINSKSTDIIAGSIDNIANVTRDDVKKYYDTWYTPDNCTTVITGEVEPAKVMSLIASNFTKQQAPNLQNRKFEELTPVQSPVRVDMTSPKTSATHIIMGFSGPTGNAPTKEKLATEGLTILLNADDQARLNKALETLNASVSLGLERMSNQVSAPSALLLDVKCTPDKTEEVLKTVYSELHKIANEPPSAKEINFIKNKMKRNCGEILDNSTILNNAVGACLMDDDLNYLVNGKKIIDYITPEDVSNAARKYLDLNKVSLSLVHPEKATPKNNISSPSFKAAVHKTAYDASGVQQYTLPNNMEVLYTADNVPTGTYIMTFNDNQKQNFKPGTDLILSKMITEGSLLRKREDFYDIARTSNIDIDFLFIPGNVSVGAKFPIENTGTAIELAKEVLQNPNLTPESFEKAKANIKERLQRAPKSAQHKLQKELFPNDVKGYNVHDILQNIDKVTLDDVKALYKSNITNSQAKIAMTAPQEHAQPMMASLSALPVFKKFETDLKKSFEPIAQNKLVFDTEHRNQAEIVQAFKFQTNKNVKDQITFDLLNTILGGTTNSRLFNDLREKQKLAYRVRSNISYTGDTGIMHLLIYTTTDNPDEGDKRDNVNKSLAGFKKHIDIMKSTPCSAEELDIAKKTLKNRILNGVESSDGKLVAISASKDSPYGLNSANIELDTIDSITPADIQAAANYIFNSNSITSVLASENTIQHLQATSQPV